MLAVDTNGQSGSGAHTNRRQWARDDIRVSDPKAMLRSIAGTAVGNFMEWYDFGIYGFLATTIGPIPSELFWNYFLVGYIFKCAVETVMLPVTYRVIAAIKKREPDYRPA